MYKDWNKIGGNPLLYAIHGSSFYSMLSSVYPEYDWLPWKFNYLPRNYWDNVNNQKKFMDWAGKELQINEMSDWYNVHFQVENSLKFRPIEQKIIELGGLSLLMKKYKGDKSTLLSTVYPEYNWLPWRFLHTPKTFWDNKDNQKKFLEWAKEQLGIKEFEDWYNVNQMVFGGERWGLILQELSKIGGVTRLPLVEMLQNVYPEYPWISFKFASITPQQWNTILQGFLNGFQSFNIKDPERRLQYVKHLETMLNIKTEQEWNHLTQKDLRLVKLPANWQ